MIPTHFLLLQLFILLLSIQNLQSYRTASRHAPLGSFHSQKRQVLSKQIRLQLSPSSLPLADTITQLISNNGESSYSLTKASSLLTAVTADFAAEIEEKVGPEIYRPIFMYGLLLGFSGILSCALAVFLVTKFNLQEALNREFDEGKQAQLVPLSPSEPSTTSSIQSTTTSSEEKIENSTDDTEKKSSGDDILEGIDV